MKLCASYHLPSHLWSGLDELRFSTQSFNMALEQLENKTKKRIIIEILDLSSCGLNIEKLCAIAVEYENLVYDCYSLDDLIILIDKIPHKCFYHFPINTYNMLYFCLQYPVTDICLGEPLTFDLPQVCDSIKQANSQLNIRVQPAVGRPELFNNIAAYDNGIQHFWILPQHMSFFEPYIDVLDLIDNNAEREKTLVELFIRQNYTRELKYYLRNSESEMLADLVTNEFVQRRIKCRQICMQNHDNTKCHYCMAEEALYRRLREKQSSNNPIAIPSQS